MAKVTAPKPYPLWKKVAWRFVRVFVATFLATLAMSLESFDLSQDWWKALVLPAITASISAVAKAIREYVGSSDYDNLIHKLVV